MNRAERRAAERGKVNSGPKGVKYSSLQREINSFVGIEMLMDRLEEGFLDFVDGVAVVRDGSDEYSDVVGELNSWISLWKRCGDRFGFSIDQSALIRLTNCLHHGVRVSQAQVRAAREVIKEQRQLFKTMPGKEVARLAEVEETAQKIRRVAA